MRGEERKEERKEEKKKRKCMETIFVWICKTPTLLNVIMVVVELIRGPMIEARVD